MVRYPDKMTKLEKKMIDKSVKHGKVGGDKMTDNSRFRGEANVAQKPLRDDFDRELVAILKSNARAKTSDIAKKLGIARTTVHERIQRLEKIGYITGYTVKLAEEPGQQMVEAYVLIEVLQQQNRQINDKLASFPEVKQALAISGEFDLLVAVEAPQLEDIDEIIDEIALIPGVRRTQSSLVLGRKLDRR